MTLVVAVAAAEFVFDSIDYCLPMHRADVAAVMVADFCY